MEKIFKIMEIIPWKQAHYQGGLWKYFPNKKLKGRKKRENE